MQAIISLNSNNVTLNPAVKKDYFKLVFKSIKRHSCYT